MQNVFIPIILVAVFFGSCSDYQKVLKNTDVKAKYDLAQKYYDEGDFKRSNRLFEQIAPKYIGKPQGERVMFFYANTYFQRKEYNAASYQFERFIKSYPKSDKVVEASFLGAKSLFNQSPEYSLDQTNTDKALAKLQIFINAHPESEFFAEANEMAQNLTTKKEKKAFEIAKQFTKLGEFHSLEYSKSAIASFDNFIRDYPGSVYFEEAYFRRFLASGNLAFNSFERVKKERLQSAQEAYKLYREKFPETKYAKKAEGMMERVQKELEDYIDSKETK